MKAFITENQNTKRKRRDRADLHSVNTESSPREYQEIMLIVVLPQSTKLWLVKLLLAITLRTPIQLS